MHLLQRGNEALTVITLVLVGWQFFSKKGTRAHIIRAHVVALFAITVVTLNTIFVPITTELRQNLFFLVHILAVIFFFLCLLITIVTGWIARSAPDMKRLHADASRVMGLLLILSVSAAALLIFFPPR